MKDPPTNYFPHLQEAHDNSSPDILKSNNSCELCVMMIKKIIVIILFRPTDKFFVFLNLNSCLKSACFSFKK